MLSIALARKDQEKWHKPEPRITGIQVKWKLAFQTADPLKQCDHNTVHLF